LNGTRPLIPFNKPYLGREEALAASDAILQGNVSGNGPIGLEVEKKLEKALKARYAMLVTSCTHAMELAFMALGVGPGDEVLLPSFTFVSTANAVLAVGAKPVFVDIKLNDLNIDPDSVAERVGPRSKAVVVVHYAGVSCQMDSILKLAHTERLHTIEDAAHAIGATWRGNHLGCIGDIGCISFHGTKNIVCGEGGAFLTNNEEIARTAEIIREKGTNRSAFLRGEVQRYTWISKGSSYVLSEVLAAVLSRQLDRMPQIIAERGKIWNRYQEGLSFLRDQGLIRLCDIPEEAGSNWHIFYLITENPSDRDGLIKHLKALGIETTFHFIPLHSSPFSRKELGYRGVSLPVTEYVSSRLLRLPIYPGLKRSDQNRVIEGISSFYGKNGSRRKTASVTAGRAKREGM
jgi:dTDP-4-amino-4,6-dideoxygalactose transaminase